MAQGITGNITVTDGTMSMRVDYSEAYDVAGNYSTISITGIYIKATGWFGHRYYPDGIVKVNGTAVVTMNSNQGTGSAYTNALNTWYLCSNSTGTSGHIAHNSDGTKSISIEVVGNRYSTFRWYTTDGHSTSGWGGTGSKTVTLTTIPRASGLTVPNFTMTVPGTITIDRKSTAFTHTLTWSIGSGSGTITVPASGNVTWTPPATMIAYTPNATSGTITFTLKTFSGSTQIGSVSKSSTLSCPSRSTFSVGDLKMGTASTITISRGAAYPHTLTWSFGGHSGSLTVPSSGNVSWTPPTSMMSYIPNALSGSITFTMTSKNGTATVGSYSLTKTLSVPSASSMSSGNWTMGTAGNITITRYATEFSHTLTWKFVNKSGSLTVGSGATVSWTPSLADLCGQIPNAMSGTVTFTLTTKNGTATVGTATLSKTLSVPNYTPSVTLTVSPSNSNTTIRGWGVYVKGYTAVSYSTSVSGLNGASVASYTVTFGGSGTKTTASGTSAVLNLKGSVAVKVVVTDSRGKSKTVTQNVTYYDYGKPGYSGQTAFRCNSAGTADPVGTYLSKKITTVNSYSCGGHNAVTAKWRYKTATGGSWSAYSNIASGTVNVSSGLEVAKPYLCEFVVTDSLGSTSSITLTIPTEKVPFNIKDGGEAAAFFGYAQEDGALEIFGKVKSAEGWETEGDNRGNNTFPDDYYNTIRWRGIKTRDAIGLPGTGSYAYLLGLRGWKDNTGGVSTEFGIGDNNIYMRKAASNTTWGPWESLLATHGSNTNGEYVRLPDGTQICWYVATVTDQAIDSAYRSLYIGNRTWTFPMAFVDTSVCAIGTAQWGGLGSWGAGFASLPSATSVRFRFYDVVSRDAGTSCGLNFVAIGRWK